MSEKLKMYIWTGKSWEYANYLFKWIPVFMTIFSVRCRITRHLRAKCILIFFFVYFWNTPGIPKIYTSRLGRKNTQNCIWNYTRKHIMLELDNWNGLQIVWRTTFYLLTFTEGDSDSEKNRGKRGSIFECNIVVWQ